MARAWRPGTKQGKPATKLAAKRLERQLSQREMSEATGIPLATYQRLEIAKRARLPYEQIVNCAMVLGVEVDELIEEKYKGWTVFSANAKAPPKVMASKERRTTAKG